MALAVDSGLLSPGWSFRNVKMVVDLPLAG